MTRETLTPVSIRILDSDGWDDCEYQIDRLLGVLAAAGRCEQREYACEGTPEQCRDNPSCTLYVAALTQVELAQLDDLVNGSAHATSSRITLRQTAESATWNPAIYYCGRACELPYFQDDG